MREADPTGISRAISLMEAAGPESELLRRALAPALTGAPRIGMTGPPGAGKSTLTRALVERWRADGRTVGVIAIDPTSPRSGGALLGDRIRMDRIALDEGVYIRSMATRGAPGGIAASTAAACDILDAAGFDRILIETVGVGQSEIDVIGVADTTVLVLVPESGDGIQVLKSGVMEVADILVVNKADRPRADTMVRELELARAIRHGRSDGPAKSVGAEGEWVPPVLATVATEDVGVGELLSAIERHLEFVQSSR